MGTSKFLIVLVVFCSLVLAREPEVTRAGTKSADNVKSYQQQDENDATKKGERFSVTSMTSDTTVVKAANVTTVARKLGKVDILEAGAGGTRPQSIRARVHLPSPRFPGVLKDANENLKNDVNAVDTERDGEEDGEEGPQGPPSASPRPAYTQKSVFTYRPSASLTTTVFRATIPPTVIVTTEPTIIVGPPTPQSSVGVAIAAPALSSATSSSVVGVVDEAPEAEDQDKEDSAEEDTDNNVLQVAPEDVKSPSSFSSRQLFTGGASRGSSRFLAGPPPSAIPLKKSGNSRIKLRDKIRELNADPTLPSDPNVITDFVFSDIKCYNTRQKEYFGATIHMKAGYHLPYIRDRPQDPLSSNECRMERVVGTNSYQMAVSDLKGCGVENCGEAMCLTMVFPRVPTLALADDEVTTIKCVPQQSTMSETRTISFAGDSLQNRRSSSTVVGGTQEFAAEVGVFRQNPGSSNGLFAKRVNSGGVVQLGEPLQLRSVVRGGDGWLHSKLTDVKVWRMRDSFSDLNNLDPSDASEVITLVDGQGCRNTEYQVIADNHPLKDPRNELVHHFTFKAFLFRGQKASEPLIVTSKVQACQERVDCVPVKCSSRDFDDNLSRFKRSPEPTEINNASHIIHDYNTHMALRVVGLKDHPSSIIDDDFSFDYFNGNKESGYWNCAERMAAAGLGGSLIMLLLCALTLALYSYIKKGDRKEILPECGRGPFSSYGSGRGGPPPPARAINRNVTSMQSTRSHILGTKGPLPLPPPGSSADGNNNKFTGKDNTAEYAVIADDPCNDNSSQDSEIRTETGKDGVYIVYYCKDKKQGRALSVPANLRRKKGKIGKGQHRNNGTNGMSDNDDDVTSNNTTEESDDSYAQGPRRTVRSVKRHHQQQQKHRGVRRRLSSFCRDNYANNLRGHFIGKGGSFPARARKGVARQVTFGRRSVGPASGSKYSDIYSMSSDLDSAYCGSVKTDESSVDYPEVHHLRRPPQGHFGNVRLPTGHLNTKGSPLSALSLNFDTKAPNNDFELPLGATTTTHFVTRNDSSTQILIVPETHV